MAIFWNKHFDRGIMLRPTHAFGRHPSACQTVVQAADVSKIHALVRWNQSRWEIIDQSRNGTTVNGRRLAAGHWTALVVGMEISFSASPNADAVWTVRDLAPPVTCLFPLDGRGEAMALSLQGNFLPSAAQPEISIHVHDGRWMLEHIGGLDLLIDGATVQTSQGAWEFVLNADLESTTENPAVGPGLDMSELTLHFEVSQNEEHTRLNLVLGSESTPLGERIHHYTLATLARLRLQDAKRGLDTHSQGWIALDELSRMLDVDPSYVNIQIFRAKHQLSSALPQSGGMPPLVERRRGEIRFGSYAFTVKRGQVEEGGLR
jgi:hypothetical protein